MAPRATALLQELVRTPSLTGNEEAVQQIVAAAMREFGLEVDVWEPTVDELAPYAEHVGEFETLAGRPNVVGIWRGSRRRKVDDSERPYRYRRTGRARSMGRRPVLGRDRRWPGRWPWLARYEGRRRRQHHWRPPHCAKRSGSRRAISSSKASSPRKTVARARWRPFCADIRPTPASSPSRPRSTSSWPREDRSSSAFMSPASPPTPPRATKAISALDCFLPIYAALNEFEAERNRTLDHPLYAEIANKIPINVGVDPVRLLAVVGAGLVDRGGSSRARSRRNARSSSKPNSSMSSCSAAASDPWLVRASARESSGSAASLPHRKSTRRASACRGGRQHAHLAVTGETPAIEGRHLRRRHAALHQHRRHSLPDVRRRRCRRRARPKRVGRYRDMLTCAKTIALAATRLVFLNLASSSGRSFARLSSKLP